MKPRMTLVLAGMLASSLVACSSDTGTDKPAGPRAPTEPGTPDTPSEDEPTSTVPDPDTITGPLLAPTTDDLFFTALDHDPEEPTAGGPPTTPKNLRIDLVSNDWAEFSWAPSNDDGKVVEYRVHRLEDGHVYTIREDQTDPAAGSQLEIDRYWKTTSFVDCHYTRFAERLHACELNGPEPGDIFTYEVSAVDDEGMESARSNQITIRYHDAAGSAVSTIDDPYGDAEFAQSHDLSGTDGFLERFELVFEDEFDEGRLNTDHWNTELIWGDATIINGEQQYFVPADRTEALGHDPFVFDDSTLTIEGIPTPTDVRERARRENLLPEGCLEIDPDWDNERCAFLSGAISSHDKFNFLYGYVESRMKVSGAAGALSSFYLYHRYAGEGVDRHSPEIDIVEYLGENPFGDEDAFQDYHYADASRYARTGEEVLRLSPTMSHAKPDGGLYSDGYHTYGVLWEPQLIIWYIDGKEIRRVSGPQVARQPLNIVTYLVTGSGWAPEPDVTNRDLFPMRYEIDWIRAWQRDGYVCDGVVPEAGRCPVTPAVAAN